MNSSQCNRPPPPIAMLKERVPILKSGSDVVKREEAAIESCYRVVLETNVIVVKS